METFAIAFLTVFTALPYAIGITLAVFRNSPVPLLAAMLVQRIGFIIFLAFVVQDVIGKSSLSGLTMLGGFLLVASTSSMVLKPMMQVMMGHLVAAKEKKDDR